MMRYIVFILMCATINIASAQIFTQVIDEQELQFKVKLIDEFFRRFNYETDYKGDVISLQGDSMALDTVAKRKNLMTLLNLDKFARNGKELDSISSLFLDYVIKNDKKLHYADTTWQSEAISSCSFEGKSYPMNLFLKTEQVEGVIYKWTIIDVNSPLFAAITDSINSGISIMPGAHGSSFITLPETINLNAKSVRSLFYKDYKPNKLAVFEYMVATGKIKIGNVTKVLYHFCLDDFNFTVERIEKEKSYNKGWLINEISKNK